MTKEIEDNVLRTTHKNAMTLAEQSGGDPSLTENEIKLYIDEVLNAVKTKK